MYPSGNKVDLASCVRYAVFRSEVLSMYQFATLIVVIFFARCVEQSLRNVASDIKAKNNLPK